MKIGTEAVGLGYVGAEAIARIYQGDTRIAGELPGGTGGGYNPLTSPPVAPSLWLDGTDGSTMFDATTGGSLVGNYGSVLRWEDKSGNGKHAITGVLGNPVRHTNTRNGCLRFTASQLKTISTVALGPQVTVFLVCRRHKPGTAGIIMESTANFESNPGMLQFYDVDKFYNGHKAEYYSEAEEATASAPDWHVWTCPHDITLSGYEATLRRDGVSRPLTSLSNGNNTTALADAVIYLGARGTSGAYPLELDLAEVLIYPVLFTEPQMAAMEAYLLAKHTPAASTFDPATLTPSMWLRVRDLVEIGGLGDGSALTGSWTDRSGNGHHFAPYGGANYPYLRLPTAGDGSGLAVQFGWPDATLISSPGAFFPASLSSVFIVMRPFGGGYSDDYGAVLSESTSAGYFYRGFSDTIENYPMSGTPTAMPFAGTPYATYVFAEVGLEYAMNGLPAGTHGSGYGYPGGGFYATSMGDDPASETYRGYIYEIIGFNRVLTPAELKNLYGYFGAEYPYVTLKPSLPWLSAVSSIGGVGDMGANYLGGQFVVKETITVTHVGRWRFAGNSETHKVGIYNNSSGLPLADAYVDCSSWGAAFADDFRYAPLATPIVLQPGTYIVASREISGQSGGYLDPANCVNRPEVSTLKMCYRLGTGYDDYAWTISTSDGVAVPVNFKYRVGY